MRQTTRNTLTLLLVPSALIADLKRYFEARKNIHAPCDRQAEDLFRAGHQRFSAPRFEDLYRRWIKHGDEVFINPSTTAIAEALESGPGRVESLVLPHSYRHLSPWLASHVPRTRKLRRGLRREPTGGTIAAGVLNPVPQPPGDHTSAWS